MLTTYVFFFNDTATTEIYTLSLHDALPIFSHWHHRERAGRPCHSSGQQIWRASLGVHAGEQPDVRQDRSEEHTSELQSPCNLVCRLLLEKKKNKCWERCGNASRAFPAPLGG